ncbi:putative aliphatic sulfonates transport permease protein SsuC [Clostridium tepidiprofundi DSM 19306]|uniref:Putative aliphatic sulfonates transport permease protein SsuC n=1 Tax=Clostridium tepidiprofundi DSM 19306 TaxID=1121338 RepID=A0A151B2K5_9CLOT|nr:ABC transporter permease [Clostridium tepidiprofundi]KYH34138.1 putative aliphatic sulfonates transport permease protein SsuC [Clostridium tepidiprofundi DSM 19306]
MKVSSIKNKFISLFPILLWISVWMIASHFVNEKLILPSPYSTFKSLIIIMSTKIFYISIFHTIIKGLIGFAISTFLGIILGFLCGLYDFINQIFMPIITTIKSTPVISIIFILILWFGTNLSPIFVSFLISFPIIWTNVVEGIKNTDKNLLEMAKIYKIKKWRVLLNVYFPSILPYITAAMSSTLGIGWKATITAEAISQPKHAIGTNLFNSKMNLDISGLFAWTIAAIILSFFFEKIFRYIEKKITPWRI